MRKIYARIFMLLAICMGTLALSAQDQSLRLSGQVLDKNSQQPIEFATVLAETQDTQKALAGTTTDAEGRFSLTVTQQNFQLKISFIGFAPLVLKEFKIEEGRVELGVLVLEEQVTTMDEVQIRAEKSQTEFKLDKRVFNVGKDLSSTGASAYDVLNNVPSVNVSIEGDISLRGSSGVQILINGKPSVLTSEQGNALGTITADMIEKIEVITNPSAKYEAEGTSGIINIVIKKEERKGINGSVTLNTGVPHNHSFGLSLNRRTEKFNLFSQLGVGYRELPREVENINLNRETGISILSEGEEFRNETFYNLILGADYMIDKNQVLTLSGYFAYEIEDQPSNTRFARQNADGETLSRWVRDEETEATNPKFQYELQYKRDFEDDEDHDLLFSALGNFFGKAQSSTFTNSTLAGENFDGNQETRTDFQEAIYTFKLDYTRPISKKVTIETGAQYVINNVSNDFAVNNLIQGEWVPDPTQTNIFEFDQNVLGVYGTGGYEGDKWGIKLGLRVENTLLNTLLKETGEENNRNFTNLFPSGHTSYKFSEQFSIQGGYSRRIRRPRLWSLNPFFNIRNDFNIRQGNPDLLPEFTDSYEVGGIFLFEKASLNVGVYHRFTDDVIERVPTVRENVTITRPLNIGTNQTTGLELNAKYTPTEWLTLSADFNFNFFDRRGSLNALSFDFSGEQWTGELRSKWQLPAEIEFEFTTQYESGFQTVLSEVSDYIFADMGLRKKLFGGRGVINMSIRDIFASRIEETETDQPDFFLYNRRFRGRFVTLGFSYGFGKGEAMEFSGRKRF